jgi:hypothetical protein
MAIRKRKSTLCKKAHEENGSSWKGELPKETIGHIQSAGCLGQKEVVTAAHNACIRELLQAIDMHGKTDRHMKLLTIEKESRPIETIEKESRVHSGIKSSVHRFALRRNCGKQRKRKK